VHTMHTPKDSHPAADTLCLCHALPSPRRYVRARKRSLWASPPAPTAWPAGSLRACRERPCHGSNTGSSRRHPYTRQCGLPRTSQGRDQLHMHTFILLSTLTDDVAQTLRNEPERILEVNAELASMGVRVISQYAVLGLHDFVNIVEAPDNVAIARVSVDSFLVVVRTAPLVDPDPRRRLGFRRNARVRWAAVSRHRAARLASRTHRAARTLEARGRPTARRSSSKQVAVIVRR
jgi:uncharacterized protein with GYD domain